MPLPVDVAVVNIATNGELKAFDLVGAGGALYFLDPSHLCARHVAAADGTITDLTYADDFTVGGNGTTGAGTLTTKSAAALPAGVLTVWRATPRIQQARWGEGDGNPSSAFTRAIDYAMAIAQEAAETLGRTIHAAAGEGQMEELPAPTVRANKAMIFDADGKPALSNDDYNDQLANVTAQANRAAGEANRSEAQADTAVASAATAQLSEGGARAAELAAEAAQAAAQAILAEAETARDAASEHSEAAATSADNSEQSRLGAVQAKDTALDAQSAAEAAALVAQSAVYKSRVLSQNVAIAADDHCLFLLPTAETGNLRVYADPARGAVGSAKVVPVFLLGNSGYGVEFWQGTGPDDAVDLDIALATQQVGARCAMAYVVMTGDSVKIAITPA